MKYFVEKQSEESVEPNWILWDRENQRNTSGDEETVWNVETNNDGSQNWVRYQNGTINEGGQNATPRVWNNETGLNHNPIQRRRKKKNEQI